MASAHRKPMSRASLHKHLLKLLERPTTKLDYATIREPGIAARVEYDPDFFPPYDVTIEVDANNGDLVKYVIHELLHVVFSPLFAGLFDDTLDEVCVVALDVYMFQYVSKSKVRLAKWTKLIEKKLAASIADEKLVPLEELVDRT